MKQKLVLMKLILGLVTCFKLVAIPNAFGSSLVEIVKGEFPSDCLIEKETVFLKKPIDDSKLYIRYIVNCPKQALKHAYLDSHIVRTMRQVLLFSLDGDSVDLIKTLVFNEPVEYKSSTNWLARFRKLILGKNETSVAIDNIDAVSGATLTSNAVKKSLRKVELIHSEISKSAYD